MIRRPTLLILGAGASVPYAFPSGRKLLDDICHGLRKENNQHFALLRACGFAPDLIARFGDALKRSGQPSVDVFLENRPEFLLVGKTAIAASLIPYEVEDNLFQNGEGSWYQYLFQRLGPTLDDVRESHLAVITFNYDRSLDRFLFLALRNSFNLTDEQVVGRMLNIPIVHVYGKLGELPEVGGTAARPYRASEPGREAAEAFAAKDAIQIVAEGTSVEGVSAFGRAKRLISDAEVICFLGFGYLKENLDRLQLNDQTLTELWGSAYDVRDGERPPILARFGHDPGGHRLRLGLASHDVLEFLRAHPILG
jgi:hypothetical protein